MEQIFWLTRSLHTKFIARALEGSKGTEQGFTG